MVVWNTADAEFDENLGEIIVKSRHRLAQTQKEGNISKPPRIVGAISILLVHSDTLNPENAKEGQSEAEINKGNEELPLIDLTAGLNTTHLCIPASLSVLPLPGIGQIYDRLNTTLNSKESANGSKEDVSNENETNHADVEDTDSSKVETSNQQQCNTFSEHTRSEESLSQGNLNDRPEEMQELCEKDEGKSGTLHRDLNEVTVEQTTSPQNDQSKSTELEQNKTHSQNDTTHNSEESDITFQVPESVDVSPNKFDNSDSVIKILENKCLVCEKDVSSFEEVVQHALEGHGKIDENDAIFCPLCTYQFNKVNMKDFLLHVPVHFDSQHAPSKMDLQQREEEAPKGKTAVIDFSNVDLSSFDTSKDSLSGTSFNDSHNEHTTNITDNLMVDHSMDENMPSATEGFESEDSLDRNTEEDNVTLSNTNQKLFCAVCGQAVKGYRDITNHNKEHGNYNQCPICLKNFSMRGSLLRHCFSHTQNKIFPCHICSAKFTRKDNLKRHIHKHDVFGPVLSTLKYRPTSFPSSSISSQNFFTGKMKEKRGFRVGLNVPKQEKFAFTSFKRQKSQNKKFTSILKSNIANKFLKSNSGDEMRSDTTVNSTLLFQQKSVIDSVGYMSNMNHLSSQDDNQMVSEHGTDTSGDNSVYLVDSDVDMTNSASIDPDNAGNKRSILSYSCSMCHVNFKKLENLKRHVITSHSEQQLDSSATEKNLHMSSHNLSLQDMVEGNQPFNADSYPQINSDFAFSNSQAGSDVALMRNSGKYEHIGFSGTEDKGDMNTMSSKSNVKLEIEEPEVIDIESLSHLPQFTSDVQVKEETNMDQQSSSFSSTFSGGEFTSGEQSSTSFQNMISDITSQVSQSQSSAGMSQEVGSAQKYPIIKVPVLQSRSNQNRRHRMLNSKLPICYFCGIFLETGSQIVKHGDEHHDKFENSCTCTICLQVLCGRDSLHRHAHSHIGTSFDCDYCTASFSRKDNLKRHLKKVHSVEVTPTKNSTIAMAAFSGERV